MIGGSALNKTFLPSPLRLEVIVEEEMGNMYEPWPVKCHCPNPMYLLTTLVT